MATVRVSAARFLRRLGLAFAWLAGAAIFAAILVNAATTRIG